ncbi:MAG: hypothetical protein L0I24_00595 [Pseudonocardia sp.]|nr:hypothetical protein [Pseudonocardia sp.]
MDTALRPREIVPDALIVCTEVYEGAPDSGAARCSYAFAEAGGRTTVTLLTELPSKEIRDVLLATGMETGLQAGWDILEQMAVSLSG